MTKLWAVLEAVSAFFGFLRGLMDRIHAAQDRQAGADAAVNAGRKQEDDALDRTQAAMDESDKKPIEYRD
jgi:hypothetical protein